MMAQVSIFQGKVRVGSLAPRLDLMNHSPTGFSWGYGGSGPAQLALAILVDHLADRNRALAIYQDFKWKCIAHLNQNEGFELTAEQIDGFVSSIEAERKRNHGNADQA